MIEPAKNLFKSRLATPPVQLGLWLALADAYAAEAIAVTGFDWLLIDAEHAPNDVPRILAQLQSLAAYPVHPVVRPAIADAVALKQLLDIGAQSVLLPMIDTAAQARTAVAATRYPPHGCRGVGAGIARASRWNQIPRYLEQAEQHIAVIVQAETLRALDNVEEIAAVEGVDAVFFGPADLSASMNLLGRPSDARVVERICRSIDRVRSAGKGAGVLAFDLAIAQQYAQAGATFLAVGADTGLLVQGATNLRQQCESLLAGSAASGNIGRVSKERTRVSR
jgi:4-hydroxy-2-oxoheptanedioate aldolase